MKQSRVFVISNSDLNIILANAQSLILQMKSFYRSMLTEFFTVNTKLPEMAILASKNLTEAKKLPPVGSFCAPLHLLDLDDSPKINIAWLHMDLNVSHLKTHARLAQLVRHWTLKPVIIRSSPTVGNFFAAVKSLDANISISDNFVLTVNNSNMSYTHRCNYQIRAL